MGFIPQVLNGIIHHGVPQARLKPELLGKHGVVDLKAVVLPHRLAALGTAGGGRQGQGLEKIDIFPA